MTERVDLRWRSPGPVAGRFMGSGADVAVINGPIGSAKTTTALMKLIRIGQRQRVSTGPGVQVAGVGIVPRRRVKFCLVRDTYRQLWKTTLPSWWKRVPKEMGDWTGSEGGPASHSVSFLLPDRTLVDMTLDFIAIGDNNVEDVMRGYEPTAFLLEEADLLVREVFNYARGRTGRFPDMSEGGPTWHGVLMTCNAPEFSSWLYQDIFTKTPDELAKLGIELFIQPGGLDPDAENLENLPADYYVKQARGQPEWYVERMIKNRPGYSRAGKPVYPEFVDRLHVSAANLDYDPALALIVGLDAGLNPAGIIGQRMPSGQWRILAEVVGETGMGARRFGQLMARVLHERFPGAAVIQGYADPSAQYGADRKAGEQTWIEIVEHEAGFRINPAPSNALTPRLEAVRMPLTRLEDGKPGLLLDPRCKVLREGFNVGYAFRKLNLAHVEQFHDEPEKNRFSHPHDGLQYLCLGGGEFQELAGRRERRERAARTMDTPSAYSPFEFTGPT